MTLAKGQGHLRRGPLFAGKTLNFAIFTLSEDDGMTGTRLYTDLAHVVSYIAESVHDLFDRLLSQKVKR